MYIYSLHSLDLLAKYYRNLLLHETRTHIRFCVEHVYAWIRYCMDQLHCTAQMLPAWICYCLDPSLDGSAIYCMDLNIVLICYNVDLLFIDLLSTIC